MKVPVLRDSFPHPELRITIICLLIKTLWWLFGNITSPLHPCNLMYSILQNLSLIRGLTRLHPQSLNTFPRKVFSSLPKWNLILRNEHFPIQWKMLKIIIISKPNKSKHLPTTLRIYSHLTVISEINDKLLEYFPIWIAPSTSQSPIRLPSGPFDSKPVPSHCVCDGHRSETLYVSTAFLGPSTGFL